MSIPKWTAGFPSFAEEVRLGEERRRRGVGRLSCGGSY
jgi:hypothetical protein